MYLLGCLGLSNDDIEMARGTVFQEIRPGAGFKTDDFVKEKLGVGATVERLVRSFGPEPIAKGEPFRKTGANSRYVRNSRKNP